MNYSPRLIPLLHFQVLSLVLFHGVVVAADPPSSTSETVVENSQISYARILVDPETTRAIEGISEVQRKRYFNVCDGGVGFEKRIEDDAMYDYLVHDLQISFGRNLGPIKPVARSLKEDPQRTGYADLTPLEKKKVVEPSERMREDFGSNLNIAAHGAHNAFPEYMGKYETEESSKDLKHSQYLPQNIEAAAMLSASVLQYAYSDFDRPRFYEPVNEPHWAFMKQRHIADWHVKTQQLVHEKTPEVQVGGPCMSVCYFYRNDYKSFEGLKNFIHNTNGNLDFYSFHTYDYLRWREGELKGRIQSGLPLEGTLDLVQNYAANAFGKKVNIVISEQGGYIGSEPKGEYDGELVAAEILNEHYPEADPESWEFELQKRSIVNFGMLSSVMANTLTFIDHPHSVQKAVPFLLVNSWNWGPKYYAQLYVPFEYEDHNRWVETDLTKFFKFFRGIKGRRVKALCNDPDLQCRSFVDDNKLFTVVNNQSYQSHKIDLDGVGVRTVDVRRLGRNLDFTTSYVEQKIEMPQYLTVAGREAVMIVAEYDKPILQKQIVNEVVCYGDKIIQPLKDATFKVKTPVGPSVDYAQLRIGLTRSPDADQNALILLNGKRLNVQLEDSAERFVDREYASTKLVYLRGTDLKDENTVSVSFADGDNGAVGSVVIRVALKQ
ncbi:Beta-porphyranase A precursor [Planctomycetes bacterium CA13]|uniref:Beta-porphyranase A n=1 Tax=Novipirellula herctigrandis TaxID=2527986 RepID=A0A5C5ZD99_9BACT|nr:Beta-porphyranase A precursor [Planctomycetes bacterium CA13]